MQRKMLTANSSIIYVVIVIIIFMLGFAIGKGYAADDLDELIKLKPGRYVPQLYGAHLGRYIPDDSGKYRHIHIPYNGGYGDRGQPYVNDFRGIFQRPIEAPTPNTFSLGPNDHLRFMIDFNFNGTGWQIIQFEWIRDGDETNKYSYANENKLWEYEEVNQPYEYAERQMDTGEIGDLAQSKQVQSEKVHVEGVYDQEQHNYHVNYSEKPDSAAKDSSQIRATLHEVLEYIQNHIIPTLN